MRGAARLGTLPRPARRKRPANTNEPLAISNEQWALRAPGRYSDPLIESVPPLDGRGAQSDSAARPNPPIECAPPLDVGGARPDSALYSDPPIESAPPIPMSH
jgi:hypothetical protein